jgi:hypothetical protein
MYAVDGMGSPEIATVERMTGQRRRELWSILREERSLQYIGTDTGADAKEMPIMMDWKCPYLRALNTDVSARIHSH